MGWTNSHLHQFDIEGKRYGDLGDYDPNADKDLYEYFLADVQEFD
jgi:hypothetical protein